MEIKLNLKPTKVKKTILNRGFYFFDKETADSISKDGRRLMEEIDFKNEGNDTRR